MKDEQTEALKKFNDAQAEIVAKYVKNSINKELLDLNNEIGKIECPYRVSVTKCPALVKVLEIIRNHYREEGK